METQELINSRYGVGLAMIFGKMVPYKTGKWLSSKAADQLASRTNSAMVRSVRTNQWVVSGCSLDSRQLDEKVRDTFRNTAHSLFILYKNINNREQMEEYIEAQGELTDFLNQLNQNKTGCILLGLHISNFDLTIRALVNKITAKTMAIGLPDPGDGYQLQNRLRLEAGISIYPATISTFRLAEKMIKDGGVVATGLDRPLAETKYHPVFFGYPSNLPVSYVSLAVHTEAPVYVAALDTRPSGKYHVNISDPIYMKPYPTREQEILINAESVMRVAEKYISQASDQWAMFYPVWPQLLDKTPQ